MVVQIQVRRDSAADWTSNDPTLAAGEIGFESDTGLFKIGDGSTAWTSLLYIIDDEAYGVSWNGATKEAPTKNAVYDKIETISAGGLSNLVEDLTPQLGGDLDLNGKNLDFPTTANISDVKDEDDLSTDSATMLATQQSIKAYVDKTTAIGSANAQWYNCPIGGELIDAVVGTGNGWSVQTTGTAYTFAFYLPLPATRNGLDLHIVDTRLTITDADGSNYVTRVLTRALSVSGGVASLTTIDDDEGDRNTIAIHDDFSYSDFDASGYKRVTIQLQTTVGTADALEIGACEIKYYYG